MVETLAITIYHHNDIIDLYKQNWKIAIMQIVIEYIHNGCLTLTIKTLQWIIWHSPNIRELKYSNLMLISHDLSSCCQIWNVDSTTSPPLMTTKKNMTEIKICLKYTWHKESGQIVTLCTGFASFAYLWYMLCWTGQSITCIRHPFYNGTYYPNLICWYQITYSCSASCI